MKIDDIFSINVGQCISPIYHPTHKVLIYGSSDGNKLVCINPYDNNIVYENSFDGKIFCYPLNIFSCYGATKGINSILLHGSASNYQVLNLDGFDLIELKDTEDYAYIGIEKNRFLTLAAYHYDEKEEVLAYDIETKQKFKYKFDQVDRYLSSYLKGEKYFFEGYNPEGRFSLGDLSMDFKKKKFTFSLDHFGECISQGPVRSGKWNGVNIAEGFAGYSELGYMYLYELTDAYYVFKICKYDNSEYKFFKLPIDDLDQLTKNGIYAVNVNLCFSSNNAVYATISLFDNVRLFDYYYVVDILNDKVIDSKIGAKSVYDYKQFKTKDYVAIIGYTEAKEKIVSVYSMLDGSAVEIKVEENDIIKCFEFGTLLIYNIKNGVLTAHEVVDE